MKETVIHRHLDKAGKVVKEYTQRQTIYQTKKGYFINFILGKKRVERDNDGRLVCIDCRQL